MSDQSRDWDREMANIDKAIAKVGPFELQNKDSKLPGCR